MLFSMKQKFQERFFLYDCCIIVIIFVQSTDIHLLGNCNNKETIREDFGSFFFQGEIIIFLAKLFAWDENHFSNFFFIIYTQL